MKYHPPGPAGAPRRPPRDYDARKKGSARLWEVLSRDIGSFFLASLLCCAAILPGGLMMLTGILGASWLLILLGGVVLGVVGAPFFCAMQDTILRSLRDEAGYWWATYRRAWGQNWRDCLVPGLLLGVFCGVWGSGVYLLQAAATLPMWLSLGAGGAFAVGFFNYVFCQIPLVSLPLGKLLENAALLFFVYLPRTLGATLVHCVYWLAAGFAFPFDVPLLLAMGFWVPCLFSTMLLYPCLDKTFGVEQTLTERRDAELEAWQKERTSAPEEK